MKLKDIAKLGHASYLEHMGAGHQEYWFMCPGCKSDHRVTTKWGDKSGKTHPCWTFNGDMERPTFSPSLLVTWTFHQAEHGFDEKNVCHSFIRNGNIEFLGDCTHELKGQTVAMADIPDIEPKENANAK